MRSLHLLVPALFWPDSGATQAGNPLRLPALETLFARGSVTEEDQPGIERWLAGHFGLDLQVELPLAAIALAGAGREPGDRFWLRADPVHLHAQGVELFLTRGADLDVRADEADAMIDALNAYFAPDGLRLEAHGSRDWYVPLAAAPALQTTPLGLAHGRSIDALLPKGDDARIWLRRVNEAQMLLHDLPVNAAREERGKPAVNSLWLWGGGRLPAMALRRVDRVLATDGLTRGFGVLAGALVDKPTAGAADLFAQASAGDTFVHLDHGTDAAARGDAVAWSTALAALDADWVAPALRAVARGSLGGVQVTGYGGRRGLTAAAGRGALRRFWRRAAPLAIRRPSS